MFFLFLIVIVKVKEQFDINIAEESVDMVRGGADITSPASSSIPITPAYRQELAGIWRCYVHLMDEINNVTQTLGKDGKFQLFICLSLRLVFIHFEIFVQRVCILPNFYIYREHLLHRMLVPVANSRITQEMYEEQSFMRKKGLLTFLRQILEPLDGFHIVLENSITQGISSQC